MRANICTYFKKLRSAREFCSKYRYFERKQQVWVKVTNHSKNFLSIHRPGVSVASAERQNVEEKTKETSAEQPALMRPSTQLHYFLGVQVGA